MSFSGGVYTLPGPALVTGEVVSATENNQFRNDVAGAFNLTMLRNGTSTATANLPMGGYKLTGLGVATISGDALSYGQAAAVSTLTATGAAALNGGITVDTSAFTVADTTGTITTAGNLTFTGTGNRITGDFSSSTAANRISFQSSIANGQTNINAIPNGTGTSSAFTLFNSADTANSSVMQMFALSTATGLSSFNTGTGTYLPMTFHTGNSERMRIDTSGNVGIGTSSPGQKLEVAGGMLAKTGTDDFIHLLSESGAMEICRSVGGAYIDFKNSAAEDYDCRIQSVGTGGNLAFSTVASERMRIDSSGNLLVGYTSKGTIAANNIAAANAFACKAGVSAALGANVFNINWTGSPQLWIDTTNVGTFAFTSDYRVKKNVETQTAPALDRVMQLRPVTYELADYGTLFKADGVQREGFIAHEVQEVIPSGAEGEKDEEGRIQNLRVDAIVAVLTKAIQELKAELDATKAEVAALKGNQNG